MGVVWAIANQKGGVGKTTTAVNLSASLAAAGKRVLVVDIDPQGNTTSGLGLNRGELEWSVYEVLLGEISSEQAIRPSTLPQLDILPATVDLAGAEVELVSMASREFRLREALRNIEERYDHILIDCPPSLGLLTVNALTAADSVLIPVQCEYYALEGLGQLLSVVRLVQTRLNPHLRVQGVLLTMYDARTNLSLEVAEEVKKYFQDRVFKTIIPRNVRLSEAPSHGQAILVYDPKSRGAEVYQQLAREVIALGEKVG